jgi:nicotinic acid mononucleotide adenylyltransferase
VHPFPGHSNITVLDSPILDISATQIRDLMKERKNIKYLVRDEVINLLKLY